MCDACNTFGSVIERLPVTEHHFCTPLGTAERITEYSVGVLIPNQMSPGRFLHPKMNLSALKILRKSLQMRAWLDFC